MERWEQVRFPWGRKPNGMVETGAGASYRARKPPDPDHSHCPILRERGFWVILSCCQEWRGSPRTPPCCWPSHMITPTTRSGTTRRPKQLSRYPHREPQSPCALECCFVFPISSPPSRNPITWPCGIQDPAEICHIASTWESSFIF